MISEFWMCASFLVAGDPVPLEVADDARLTVTAHWSDIEESVYSLHEQYEVLQDFAPARPEVVYEAEAFRALLPDEPVGAGDVWKIDQRKLLPFLQQFHEGAEVRLHHGGCSPGAYGMLRAINDRHAEILLRLHGEFVLEPGNHDRSGSWLTPAQFTGPLILDRATGQIVGFQLAVPPRNGNFDVIVPFELPPNVYSTGPTGGAIADIGFLPRMELVGGDVSGRDDWSQEVAIDEARWTLARRFYEFVEIEWLEVPDAYWRSQETGRPIHLLTMFGTLDDESC